MRRCNELTRHMGQRIAEKTVEAETDPLTGVLNRRGFDRRLRGQGEGAVVLLDLDGFKAVNDRIGHAAGDRLLCAVARQLAAALRQGDVLARLGGDEFAVWLPGAGQAEARAVAGRLRAAVAALPQDSGTPVTLSGGVAVTRPGQTLAETLETADRALRRAKIGDRIGPAPGIAATQTPTCRD
ncbi:MAG: GGDEF domain-containing protein [Rhodobacterales bacterium]|nr:GGDEF domain-containing protein [Rhodobacterales bacterium]